MKEVCFKNVLVIAALILAVISLVCSDDGTNSEKENYSAAFEKIWSDFDLNYSYFVYKGINWDSLKTVYYPSLDKQISYNTFIRNYVAPMLTQLRDLHVNLVDKNDKYVPLYSRKIDINYRYDDNFYNTYFHGSIHYSSNYMFGFASVNDSIGYILIKTWQSKYEADVAQFHDSLNNYRNYKALIIDVRSNNGGSETLGQEVAGRFTDSTKVYAYHKFRNGPEHDDFTSLQARSISPTGTWQFTKPVALLIGEKCMSSSEGFILMMASLSHVTTIGDTTRGSSGNPKEFHLNDDTRYSIPRWVAYKTDQTILEDVGIFPDVVIDGDQSIVNNRDLVLEKAIEFLSVR